MTLLSLDVSTNVTGWAVFKDEQLLDFGEIKLKRNDESTLDLFNRLTEIIKQYSPTQATIEDIFCMNKVTFKRLAEFRGVIILLCQYVGLPLTKNLNASTVRKRVFGNAKITKQEIAQRLSVNFGQDLVTKGFDAADAIALGLATLGKVA
jgi:Holliday junction resolvasome RuvABC endonuclease subunit